MNCLRYFWKELPIKMLLLAEAETWTLRNMGIYSTLQINSVLDSRSLLEEVDAVLVLWYLLLLEQRLTKLTGFQKTAGVRIFRAMCCNNKIPSYSAYTFSCNIYSKQSVASVEWSHPPLSFQGLLFCCEEKSTEEMHFQAPVVHHQGILWSAGMEVTNQSEHSRAPSAGGSTMLPQWLLARGVQLSSDRWSISAAVRERQVKVSWWKPPVRHRGAQGAVCGTEALEVDY